MPAESCQSSTKSLFRCQRYVQKRSLNPIIKLSPNDAPPLKVCLVENNNNQKKNLKESRANFGCRREYLHVTSLTARRPSAGHFHWAWNFGSLLCRKKVALELCADTTVWVAARRKQPNPDWCFGLKFCAKLTRQMAMGGSAIFFGCRCKCVAWNSGEDLDKIRSVAEIHKFR